MAAKKIETKEEAQALCLAITTEERFKEFFSNESSKSLWLKRFYHIYREMGREDELNYHIFNGLAGNLEVYSGSVENGLKKLYIVIAECFTIMIFTLRSII